MTQRKRKSSISYVWNKAHEKEENFQNHKFQSIVQIFTQGKQKMFSSVIALHILRNKMFVFTKKKKNSIICKFFSRLPDEFRSKVACENDVIQLMCNPYSRIAIYGASYGKTEYESLQCAQPSQASKDESKCAFISHNYIILAGNDSNMKIFNYFYLFNTVCPASFTTETVMKFCHGQRKCSLTADSATFGKPCKPETRMYLKVVYTCGKLTSSSIIFLYSSLIVFKLIKKINFSSLFSLWFVCRAVPKKVLKDRYDTPPEPDEPQQNDIDHDHDELYDDDQFYKEPEAIPPEPKLQGDLAKDRSSDSIPSINSIQPSSVHPPMRNRDDSTLEGKLCQLSMMKFYFPFE